MELTINSPTSSIMKLPFSPTASPLSSPLSSPTKSGRAKKTISFLLPDNQRPSGSAAAEKEETKEKLEEKAEMKEKEENGEDEVETKSISEENRRRPVYEYPDLHVSASGYRFLFRSYIYLPKRMNFRKSSKRPLIPPPHFLKVILQFFSEIHDRSIVYNGKNLQ